ncbi:hypothetical protein HDU92_008921 [Lobulomyces angularis]|nr:hypothetical protein HDU92_008921 [Lobulomyces angularis]
MKFFTLSALLAVSAATVATQYGYEKCDFTCMRKETSDLTEVEWNNLNTALEKFKSSNPDAYKELLDLQTKYIDENEIAKNLPRLRVWLAEFENHLNKIDPSVCLPYFDQSRYYSNVLEAPACSKVPGKRNSDPKPYEIASPEVVASLQYDCLSAPNPYEKYSNEYSVYEALANSAVGGDAVTNNAANDFLTVMRWAGSDYHWSNFQTIYTVHTKGDNSKQYGEYDLDTEVGYGKKVRDCLDTRDLCYGYVLAGTPSSGKKDKAVEGTATLETKDTQAAAVSTAETADASTSEAVAISTASPTTEAAKSTKSESKVTTAAVTTSTTSAASATATVATGCVRSSAVWAAALDDAAWKKLEVNITAEFALQNLFTKKTELAGFYYDLAREWLSAELNQKSNAGASAVTLESQKKTFNFLKESFSLPAKADTNSTQVFDTSVLGDLYKVLVNYNSGKDEKAAACSTATSSAAQAVTSVTSTSTATSTTTTKPTYVAVYPSKYVSYKPTPVPASYYPTGYLAPQKKPTLCPVNQYLSYYSGYKAVDTKKYPDTNYDYSALPSNLAHYVKECVNRQEYVAALLKNGTYPDAKKPIAVVYNDERPYTGVKLLEVKPEEAKSSSNKVIVNLFMLGLGFLVFL